MLAALSVSFVQMAESSVVNPPAQQQQIAAALEDDAEDLSLQIALLVPLLAGLLGSANSFRMLRLPRSASSADLDGLDLG